MKNIAWLFGVVIIVVCLLLSGSWLIQAQYSTGDMSRMLESGKFYLGSEPCCVKPRRAFSHWENGHPRFLMWVCQDSERILQIYFAFEKSADSNRLVCRAFAAQELPKRGGLKWYFCDIEKMAEYLAVVSSPNKATNSAPDSQ